MPIDVLPIRAFIDELGKWADEIEQGNAADAKFRAQHIKKVAELLTIDPEFQRIFFANKDTCDSHNPKAALDCLSAFLHSVADAIQPKRYRAASRGNGDSQNSGR